MKRITVIMPDEVYDKVIELAKKEKRKKSPMAAMLIEDGLKLALPVVINGDDLIGVLNRKK
jgi:predicted transcriptional regulator